MIALLATEFTALPQTPIGILSTVITLLLSGGLGTMWLMNANKRKLDAEGTSVFSQATVALLAPLTARVEHLEKALEGAERKLERQGSEIEKLRLENLALRSWALNLSSQVRMLGGDPAPFPDLPNPFA